jgi:hypothetical protein
MDSYLARTRDYPDVLGSTVAIWKVGNEINVNDVG